MSERVWDRFLTEQDKAHVAMKEPRPIGFGKKPALLLIDLYRWVFGDKPEPVLEAIKEWPGSCGMAGWDAIPHIQKLLQTAREVGIPVIHISGPARRRRVDEWSFRRDSSSTNLSAEALERRRNKFDIIDEVQPLPGEAVLRKLSPSAFWGTPLIAHLNQLRHRYRSSPAVRAPAVACAPAWWTAAPTGSAWWWPRNASSTGTRPATPSTSST